MVDTAKQKRGRTPWRRLALAAALACAAPRPAGAADMAAGETHTLNFRDADIVAFIEDVSALTGYTLIVHPEVRGNVTVTSQAQLTREQVFEVFLSTLRTYGYTAIPTSSGTYRIVPETSAAQNTGEVGTADRMSDEFVTEVFSLRHFSAVEAARIVTPLVNHRGQVSASAPDNLLIVADYAGNIGRIRELITEMDQDRSVTKTITLVSASARDVASVVKDIEVAGADPSSPARATAMALEGTNAVVLRGDPEAVSRMAALVGELDVASMPTDNLRVIRLQNARAKDVVPVLEGVARTMLHAGQELVIPYDEATNSVVLTSDPQTVSALARVVQELDVRRPQVLVEAIIVEIGQGVARDLGVQYLIAGKDDSQIPFAASNYSKSAPNLLAITGALTMPDSGDGEGSSVGDNVSLRDAAIASILGAQGGIFGVGGENSDGIFGAILTALQNDTESNVLSTPHVATLDNEAAKILVGQEIPITTGEVLGSANVNPFRSIQRKDVGVTLEVTPQITQGDTIKLSIRQEVSSIADQVQGEIVTNKREISTTVLADDGETIVLGGLIEGTEKLSKSKVPLLGDVPLLGKAFQQTSRERVRTNLVVFIRAKIVRSAADAKALAEDSMSNIAAAQDQRHTSASRRFDRLLRDALGEGYEPE